MSDVSQPGGLAQSLTRRGLLAGVGGLWLGAGAAGTAAAPGPRTITVLGDSIAAGFGLPAVAAMPVQLQAALARLGVVARVRAAGVSGDTSADGLARADFSVQADTDLCLVELGGNDLLQGVDPKLTARNLQAIVRRLKARRIAVLLVGLKAPPSIGAAYAREFNAIFPGLARQEQVPLVPDMFVGLGSNALRQRDGLHPNAQGAQIMAQALAPAVAAALRRRG